MSKQVYRIMMEYCPPNGPGDRALPEAYYGCPPGSIVYQNQPIYYRTDFKHAFVYSERDCVAHIRYLREHTYPCHAVPSITITETF